jgi:hypothetical protein
MRQPLSARAGIALLMAAAWAGGALAQSAAQSQPPPDAPANAANKPKDSASNPPPKKVYTNDDLKGTPREDVSVVGNNRGTGRSAPATGERKDQQYWHNRAQRIRNEMAEVDRQIALLTKPDPATGASIPSSPPPPPGAHATTSRPAAQLQRLQGRKEQLQQQMDQLEEEARKAEVPPGWLR